MTPAHGRVPVRIMALLGAALLAVPSSGCGEDEQPSTATADTAIEARDFAFEPAERSVKVGATVTWTNTGETTHNVKGPGFFSEAIAPDETYEHRFTKPGTFDYLCNLHPTMMRGTIEVSGSYGPSGEQPGPDGPEGG